MAKVIKDIVYANLETEADSDFAITINGLDLTDVSREVAIEILNQNNLIDNNNVIIPKGMDVTKEQYGGAVQYIFKNHSLEITTDLYFDGDEMEYIA